MADDTQLTLDESPGNNRRWIIIAIVVVLVAVGGGGIGWWLSHDDDVAADATEAVGQTVSRGAVTLYVPMPRPFVFNVRSDERDRLVQIKVQLMVHGTAAEDLAKQHIPLIEGALLHVFSAATVGQLTSLEGKQGIRERALVKVQEALHALTGSAVVDKVLFTGFVMQ